ncbi:unnamed protein product [Pleuronectes platessa]|uniref:Transmembrane protein n=1 Tax=Pleuronectes platessa TaxID=8262 RepID=A0A9N7V7U3_PLEPL|nr:unnamed protein product [Pleuronectes platessa]
MDSLGLEEDENNQTSESQTPETFVLTQFELNVFPGACCGSVVVLLLLVSGSWLLGLRRGDGDVDAQKLCPAALRLRQKLQRDRHHLTSRGADRQTDRQTDRQNHRQGPPYSQPNRIRGLRDSVPCSRGDAASLPVLSPTRSSRLVLTRRRLPPPTRPSPLQTLALPHSSSSSSSSSSSLLLPSSANSTDETTVGVDLKHLITVWFFLRINRSSGGTQRSHRDVLTGVRPGLVLTCLDLSSDKVAEEEEERGGRRETLTEEEEEEEEEEERHSQKRRRRRTAERLEGKLFPMMRSAPRFWTDEEDDDDEDGDVEEESNMRHRHHARAERLDIPSLRLDSGQTSTCAIRPRASGSSPSLRLRRPGATFYTRPPKQPHKVFRDTVDARTRTSGA